MIEFMKIFHINFFNDLNLKFEDGVGPNGAERSPANVEQRGKRGRVTVTGV